MNATTLVGVDIGGTDTKIALLDESCRGVAETVVLPTSPADGPELTLDRISRAVTRLTAKRNNAGICVGVAFPGNVDRGQRRPVFVPALGDRWAGYDVAAHLMAGCQMSAGDAVEIVNDVHAMTLAEWRLGAARGHDNVLCVALGTGVGGGIVVDGRLRFGVDDTAGSIGHTTVDPDGEACTCGNVGCLERYSSGPAIAASAGTRTAAEAATAAADGDSRALAALDRAARALGVAIGNTCTMLTPTMVVLGGGVADAGPILVDRIIDAVSRRVTVASFTSTQFATALFGNMAGAVGAAMFVGLTPDDSPSPSTTPSKEHNP